MTDDFKAQMQERWDALHKVADRACERWFSLVDMDPKDPSLEGRFIKAFDHAFPEIFAGVLSRHDDELQVIAEALLKRWIADGSIVVDEPTPAVKAAIEDALEGIEQRPRAFVDEARRRKVEALALAEKRVPYPQIAKTFGITSRTAKKWVEDEREALDTLRKALSIYGYKAVRADEVA